MGDHHEILLHASKLESGRIEYMFRAGHDTAHKFTSPCTEDEISRLAKKMLDDLNGCLYRFADGQVTVGALIERARIAGVELTDHALDAESQRFLGNYLPTAHVLAIANEFCQRLPWELMVIPHEAEAEGCDNAPFVGDCLCVARLNARGMHFGSPDWETRRIDTRQRGCIQGCGVEPKVKGARGVTDTIEELVKQLKGKHLVRIVAHGAEESDPGVRIGQNLTYTARHAKAYPFPKNCLVIMLSCKVGAGGVPEAIAAHSRCSVLSCLSTLPVADGVRLANLAEDLLPVSGEMHFVDFLRTWRDRGGELTKMFVLHGCWDMNLVGDAQCSSGM